MIKRGNIVRLKHGIAPGRRADAEVLAVTKATGAVALSRQLAGFAYWNVQDLELVAKSRRGTEKGGGE